MVAPVRERGLKLLCKPLFLVRMLSRSRKGAWIEIYMLSAVKLNASSRSRKGAWIEIKKE